MLNVEWTHIHLPVSLLSCLLVFSFGHETFSKFAVLTKRERDYAFILLTSTLVSGINIIRY